MSTPRLEGRLSCLRPFSPEDEPAFISQAAHPEMFEFMKFRFATEQEATDAFRWLTGRQQSPDPDGPVYWALERKDDHVFVGWVGLARRTPDVGDEIGWYLVPPFWGQGFASDATAQLLTYGFDVLGSNRIMATCDPENRGSKRVLEKVGMTNEGALPELVETWRGPRPRLQFSITPDGARAAAPAS